MIPISTPLVGLANSYPEQPGFLYEGINYGRLDPQFVYNLTINASTGEYLISNVYSCLTDSLFSWQLLSREPDMSKEEINSFVQEAAALGLDVSGVRIVDQSPQACGYNRLHAPPRLDAAHRSHSDSAVEGLLR